MLTPSSTSSDPASYMPASGSGKVIFVSWASCIVFVRVGYRWFKKIQIFSNCFWDDKILWYHIIAHHYSNKCFLEVYLMHYVQVHHQQPQWHPHPSSERSKGQLPLSFMKNEFLNVNFFQKISEEFLQFFQWALSKWTKRKIIQFFFTLWKTKYFNRDIFIFALNHQQFQ